MKWLFVTIRFPWPLTHGTWLRVYHLTAALAREEHQVALLTYPGPAEAQRAYTQAGVTLLAGPKGVPPYRGRARSRLAPYVFDPALAKHLAERAGDYDVVVLAHLNALQYAQEAAAAKHLIADIVDDPILEWSRKLWRTYSPLGWLENFRFRIGVRRYEKAFIERVDLACFVSEQDAESFGRRHGGVRTVAVPNGVSAAHFANPHPDNGRGDAQPTVLFLGNMSHVPNEDAALYLAREIAPRVWQTMPRARFVIAGCEPRQAVRDLAGPNIDVTGWVDDLRPTLWDATVVILPMRIGTGIKNKLLEAWAAEKPVIATPLACQGVPAKHQENIFLADTRNALADATVNLINDKPLRKRLARHGKQTIEESLTWPIAADRLCRCTTIAHREDRL